MGSPYGLPISLGEGQIVLAVYLQEGKVAAFFKHLYQEGFDYNTSWERPLGSGGVICW